jgi:hypothetical protein
LRPSRGSLDSLETVRLTSSTFVASLAVLAGASIFSAVQHGGEASYVIVAVLFSAVAVRYLALRRRG